METNSIINSYSLTSLTADVRYKIFITAKYSNGESSKNNKIVGYLSSVHNKFTTATLVSNSRISNLFKVTWDITSITSSFPILGYEVLVKDLSIENSDYNTVYNRRYINNFNTITISNLINGHFYNIIYYAFNKYGRSEKSPLLKYFVFQLLILQLILNYHH